MSGEEFTFGLPDFVPGGYTLSVSGIDVFEQLGSLERSFTITDGRGTLTRLCKWSICQSVCACMSQDMVYILLFFLSSRAIIYNSTTYTSSLCAVLIKFISAVELECIHNLIADLDGLNFFCFGVNTQVQSAVCRFDDGRPALDPCK